MSFDEKKPLLSPGGPQNEASPADLVENPPAYEEPARLGTIRFYVVCVLYIVCVVSQYLDMVKKSILLKEF